MDTREAATTAVTLIVPLLNEGGKEAAKQLGKAAFEGVGNLLQLISSKLRQHDYGLQTLERLESRPDSEARRGALAAVIAEEAMEDPGFGAELIRLVEALSRQESVANFLTVVTNGGHVGTIYNVQNARDVGPRGKSST